MRNSTSNVLSGSCLSPVPTIPAYGVIANLTLARPSKQGGERGGSGVECRTPEREVRGSRPTSAVLCPWARHFTPRKYWLITQEAMAPSRHDWKIVDWDVKPQHNQPTLSRAYWVNLQIIWKKILWKYSIQSFKTADSILLSLVMTDNGRCEIPSGRLAPGWALLCCKQMMNPTVPKDQKMWK